MNLEEQITRNSVKDWLLKSCVPSRQFILNNWIFILPVIAIGVAGLLVATYAKVFPSLNTWLHINFQFREASAWGQLGDFIGGLLNPLISLFTLLIAALVWKLQKKELKETKDTLRKQIDIDIVFRQIQIHQSLVENLTYATAKGRDAFRLASGAIWSQSSARQSVDIAMSWVFGTLDCTSTNDRVPDKDAPMPNHLRYVRLFGHAYETGATVGNSTEPPFEFFLGHYFRSVYSILLTIQESKYLSAADKKTLVEVLRSMLSEEEFVLLAANGATKRGRKFRARALRSDLFRSRLTLHPIGKTFVLCYESNQENLKWANKVLAEG